MPTCTTSKSRANGRLTASLKTSQASLIRCARYAPNTVETTYLYNDVAKTRAYYAFPLKQQTMHVQYWADMLTEAGFKESDIPTN